MKAKEESQQRWGVQVEWRAGKYGTETNVLEYISSGRSEEFARKDFRYRSSVLDFPWISQVTLICNGREVETWSEWTNLSEQQRGLRDAFQAADLRLTQAYEARQREMTGETYEALRAAEDARQLACSEFTLGISLREAEYKRELEIRRRYSPPEPSSSEWPYGHQELACDGDGVVTWRGVWIDRCWNWDWMRIPEETHYMAAHCRHIESLGLPVNGITFTWFFDWFRMLDFNHPYKELLTHLGCGYWIKPGTEEIALVRVEDYPEARALYYDGTRWHRIWYEYIPTDHPSEGPWAYHGLYGRGWRWLELDQGENAGIMFASVSAVIAWYQAHGISPTFLTPQGGPWCTDTACQWCRLPHSESVSRLP